MKVVDCSFLKKYRLYIIVGSAILIGIFLICISIYYVFNENAMVTNEKLFDIKQYYAEYEITVISNKNRNIYTMNEWYKVINNEECFRFTFKDVLGFDSSYIVRNSNVKISNDNQLNSYIINSNKFTKTNLFSIATYINIINRYSETSYYDIKEENENYIIYLNKDRHKKCNGCDFHDIYSDGLNINKIEVNLEDNKPKSIYVYSLNNVYIEVIYKIFDVKTNIEDNIFNI